MKRAARPTWPLQDAKARFSELVRKAVDEGPQSVSVRGAPTAVVLSEAEYRRLTGQESSIVDDLLEGPDWPADLVEAIADRSGSGDRDVGF